jgi:hypothetical protein
MRFTEVRIPEFTPQEKTQLDISKMAEPLYGYRIDIDRNP